MKRSILFLFASLIVSGSYAQSNAFKLTDSTFAVNTSCTFAPFDYYNIYYTQADKIRIDSIKNFLIANPCIHIQINWHTDQRGNAKYNQVLSKRYAERLMWTLVQLSVPENRIKTEGCGENEPVVDEVTINSLSTTREQELAYAKNRRIEIIIIKL